VPVGDARRRLIEAERALAQAHAALEAAQTDVDALRRALDAMPQGVVVCDASGRMVFRNRHAEALFAARDSDALAARALSEVLVAARRGEAETRTLELHGPPPRTLVLTGSTACTGDQPGASIAVIEDISERRYLEAVRRDFVANVSHELRTPVGALAILAETLNDEQDPDVVRRLADRIGNEAERVGRIIEDLLDLSRMEADDASVHEPVAVGVLVAGALERVRPTAEHHGVEIDVSGQADSLKVIGDERQLVSALGNLLDNAVKYSDAGAVVEVGAHTHDGWVEVAVRDNGIGIPSKDLERIFERFYRVDRARSRQTGGTGLGLSIVRHIATNHGGQVLVESREGEGSTFTLRLPVDS
jgi:two-component system sensor histidine kinase SenX3